jgi:hypothetical protein
MKEAFLRLSWLRGSEALYQLVEYPNAAQASLSRPHRKEEQKTTPSILGELQNFVSDIRGDYIATREKSFSIT